MPTVKITTESGTGPFTKGNKIILQATVEGGSASSYSWARDGTPVGEGTQHEITVGDDTKGSYTATASIGEDTIVSDPFEVSIAADAPGQVPSPANGGAAEPPPRFYKWFAAIAALVTAAVGWLILRDLFNHRAGFSEADWTPLDQRLKTGAALSAPLLILGGILLLVGLWMAVVEWRGRFAKEEEERAAAKGFGGQDVGTVVEAIGKLRGAALAMVVGAILMLASAWVAQSTTAPSPSPTPSPSGSTTTAPAAENP